MIDIRAEYYYIYLEKFDKKESHSKTQCFRPLVLLKAAIKVSKTMRYKIRFKGIISSRLIRKDF
jgi:hypothetical protein